MQTQGSLRDGGLATLLQSMQAERATGTLTIDNGGDSCSLYFLFGHLFHANGPGGQGEEVVIDALGWDDGSYQFDPRAKLPAEETIKASPAELIAAAESRQRSGCRCVGRCFHLARGSACLLGPSMPTPRPCGLPEPIEEPAYAVAGTAAASEPAADTYAPALPSRSMPRCPNSTDPCTRASRVPDRFRAGLVSAGAGRTGPDRARRVAGSTGSRRVGLAATRPYASTRSPRAAPTTRG